MKHPNFIIAGGLAAGTSFLSRSLRQHPEIYLPVIERPEPNVFHFSQRFALGREAYLAKWFSHVASERAIGERSSLLLTSPDAPQRLHSWFPDIKVIITLRNPIERAWANYRFTVLEGLEPLPFSAALAVESHRRQHEGSMAEVWPHAYIERSRYVAGIKEFFDVFGSDQVLLIKSEEMNRNPQAVLADVCEFVGVSRDHEFSWAADFTSPSVKDRELQARLRQALGDQFPSIVEIIRQDRLADAICDYPGDERLISLLAQNLASSKCALDPRDREVLRAELADELEVLPGLVPFDISDWQ